VIREVKGGWTIGTVILEADGNVDITKGRNEEAIRPMVLQYQVRQTFGCFESIESNENQNEFLIAALQNADKSLEPLVTTPDLISVLDQDGTPLGTPELRYGLRVSVIAMPADPLWMTREGMEAASPAAFGFEFDYKRFPNAFGRSKSVIEEFGV
jgi:hypothetical protein